VPARAVGHLRERNEAAHRSAAAAAAPVAASAAAIAAVEAAITDVIDVRRFDFHILPLP
jgi:hypothetical protein